jgi:hypothetical protein
MTFIDTPNHEVIERLYAIMSVDLNGNTGICATILPGLGSTPLITGSKRILEAFKKLAREMPQSPGTRVWLRLPNE